MSNVSALAASRVCYDDPNCRGQFYEVFVTDRDAVEKWRKNHNSVPIGDVVQTYDVFFHSNQSSHPQRPSRQMLEATFGTDHNMDVINCILEKGEFRHGSRHVEKLFAQNVHGHNVTD